MAGFLAWISCGCAGVVDGEPLGEAPTDPAPPIHQPSPPGEPNAPPSVPDPSAKSGLELYTLHCAACHGEAGAGTPLAPEVQHPKGDYAEWVVRNGLSGAFEPPMIAFEVTALDDAELTKILDYLADIPTPTEGEALYLDYCANCHGRDALGGPARKKIAGKDELLEDVRRGRGGNDFGERTRFMPAWSSEELSPEQMSALQTYVESLPDD